MYRELTKVFERHTGRVIEVIEMRYPGQAYDSQPFYSFAKDEPVIEEIGAEAECCALNLSIGLPGWPSPDETQERPLHMDIVKGDDGLWRIGEFHFN